MLSLLDGNLARRHFGHADAQECNRAEFLVVCLDENDRSRSHGRDVLLRCGLADRVGLVTRGKVLKQGFGIVCPVDDVCLFDRSRDGRVPAVVRQGGEKGLVDGSTDVLFRLVVKRQYVEDRVRLGTSVYSSTTRRTCPLTQNWSLALTL